MTPKLTSRHLPPRRLLAVAAALALFGGPVEAQSAPDQSAPAAPTQAQEPAPATVPATPARRTPEMSTCPLGTFRCNPRPVNYNLCRPNDMLGFYDPTLSKDSSVRDTSNTYVTAERVDGANQTVYHLEGQVKVERADQRLQADVADYNDDTTDYDARGNVRYQEVGQLVSADHMRGNQDASTATADNVAYQMLTNRGSGVAVQGQMLDDQRSRYIQATYSTCDIDDRTWEIRAKDIRMDKETGEGTAHDATMYLHGVPFFWLPTFTFPINDERKTGFLTPSIGNSSRSGFMLSAPYYLNLAPNYDATLDPRIYTDRGFMLASEFRYVVPGSTGQVNLEFLPNDQGSNDPDSLINTKNTDRWLLKLNDLTHLYGPFNFSTSINLASDRNYMRDFGNDLFTATIGQLPSNAYVGGGGMWGKAFWNASIGADYYQNVDYSLPDTSVQYKRWPRGTFNVDWPINTWLEVGANNEAVAFRRPDSVEGNRLDLYPYVSANFQGAAWFVRPKVAYRYTGYDLTGNYQQYGFYSLLNPGQTSPFTTNSPSRSLPVVDLDTGLIFDRSTSLFGTAYTQTLEPRLYYLYVPYRNQDNIPLFDTNLMSFDTWQLFTTNTYSGADRQINANNLSAMLTSRLLDDNGVERLSASFGQIRYFTQQRVQVPNGNTTIPTATNWSGSDYAIDLTTQLNDDWRLTSQYQWNPNTRMTDLGAIGIQHRLSDYGIVNFSYRFRRTPGTNQPLLEQYDASAVYSLTDRWRLIGRWTYSTLTDQTIEADAGVQYDSCCVALRLIARHYVNTYNVTTAVGSANTAVMLEVEFKGMGNFSGQSENVLRSGILGYQ
ncbi:LPS-assembly protein LptD [Dyella solisilvae]|uniref:LPS-assembly protein LptD n=1 Tax=Dyella solisilvae TaxID=1920168 RepID=A0A370K6V2_9GAMM|nr:LPS assembly protein LptD [Dyella solisilvae]RDI98376.1 LPS-assembly protein LptD [Dyella solisilvae]